MQIGPVDQVIGDQIATPMASYAMAQE